jgi:hypothetical protein
LIDIDGDPIEHNRKAGSYSCQFDIRLAGDDGFHTPAGATWLDLTFHEREGEPLAEVGEGRPGSRRTSHNPTCDQRASTARGEKKSARQLVLV